MVNLDLEQLTWSRNPRGRTPNGSVPGLFAIIFNKRQSVCAPLIGISLLGDEMDRKNNIPRRSSCSVNQTVPHCDDRSDREVFEQSRY